MLIALLLVFLAGCGGSFQGGEPSPPDPLDSGAATDAPTTDASGATSSTADSSSADGRSAPGDSDSSSTSSDASTPATSQDAGPTDAAPDAEVCCTLYGTTLCSHTRCIDCGGDTVCAY